MTEKGYRHEEQTQGQPKRKKTEVPVLLLQEVVRAAISRNKDNKRVYVLDLFSGYGSMRPVALQNGLKYIGVDIKHPKCVQ